MVLIFQIAVGILLGFLLIEYRHTLGRWALLALKLALGAVVGVAVGTALSYVPSAVGLTSDSTPDWLIRLGEKLLMLPTIVALFAILGTGTYGFVLLVRKALRRWPYIGGEPGSFIFLGFLNVLLIWPVDLYLQWNTPYGEFYRSLDRWSRQAGYADSIASLLSFSLTLWPWIVILIARRFGVEFGRNRTISPSRQGENEGGE